MPQLQPHGMQEGGMKNGLSFAFPDHHLSFAVPRLTSLAVSLTHTPSLQQAIGSLRLREARVQGHQDERGAKGASERGRGKRTRIDRSSGSSSRSRGKRCSLSTLAISLTLPGLSLAHSLTHSFALTYAATLLVATVDRRSECRHTTPRDKDDAARLALM